MTCRCTSYLGCIGGEQPIFLAPRCGVGSIVHEIMHALGFHHEHTRKDREQYVRVLHHNIMEGKSRSAGMQRKMQTCSINWANAYFIFSPQYLKPYLCWLNYSITLKDIIEPAQYLFPRHAINNPKHQRRCGLPGLHNIPFSLIQRLTVISHTENIQLTHNYSNSWNE